MEVKASSHHTLGAVGIANCQLLTVDLPKLDPLPFGRVKCPGGKMAAGAEMKEGWRSQEESGRQCVYSPTGSAQLTKEQSLGLPFIPAGQEKVGSALDSAADSSSSLTGAAFLFFLSQTFQHCPPAD